MSEGDHTPGRVVGIGASAGGVDALIQLVGELPAGFGAAICIVLHLPSSGRSLLAPILGRHTELEVVEAQDDQRLEAGRIYVAPNDRHLLLTDGHLHLDRGPKENGVRPAVDVMLRTLAVVLRRTVDRGDPLRRSGRRQRRRARRPQRRRARARPGSR